MGTYVPGYMFWHGKCEHLITRGWHIARVCLCELFYFIFIGKITFYFIEKFVKVYNKHGKKERGIQPKLDKHIRAKL